MERLEVCATSAENRVHIFSKATNLQKNSSLACARYPEIKLDVTAATATE
jgi:hypothetical protein